MDRISKAIVELLKQTSIYCGSTECRFSGSCGECALREVVVIDGKCTNYERRPEKYQA